MKILVADDHQLIVEDMLDELEDIVPDAECIGTNDPSAILSLVDKHRFDVILMDIDLDYANGIDLSYRTHASAFLMKPVGTEKLKDALNNLRYPVSDIKDEEIERSFQGSFKVGHLIQTYRKERGISAAKLAEEIGCAQQTVYRWESGTRVPDIPTLMQIAKILGVNLDDLTR